MKKFSTRNKYLRLFLVLTVQVATLSVCRANPQVVSPSPADVGAYRDAIQSAYTAMTSAFVDNHLDRSAIFFSNDYRQVDPKGQVLDKDGSREKFQSERDKIRTIESQCSIDSMTAAPDGVHVEMTTHSSGTGAKRILFFNVSGTFTNDLHVIDLWVSTPDGWRLKSRLMLQDLSIVHAS